MRTWVQVFSRLCSIEFADSKIGVIAFSVAHILFDGCFRFASPQSFSSSTQLSVSKTSNRTHATNLSSVSTYSTLH